MGTNLDKVKQYLLAKGIKPDELTISQVRTQKLYKNIEVSSINVAKITEISRMITDLIDQGIQLSSGAPQYLYRKLDELKLEMLGLVT